jgi:hypothetical protein
MLNSQVQRSVKIMKMFNQIYKGDADWEFQLKSESPGSQQRGKLAIFFIIHGLTRIIGYYFNFKKNY